MVCEHLPWEVTLPPTLLRASFPWHQSHQGLGVLSCDVKGPQRSLVAAEWVGWEDHGPSPTSPSFDLFGRTGLLVRFHSEKGFHCFKQV